MFLRILVSLVAVCAIARGGEPAASASWEEIRHRTFEEVWQTVNESYYDPNFGGVDWRKVGDDYRARLVEVADKPQLVALLQQMLGELRKTHFAILPREASVFTPAERVRMGTIGARLTCCEGQVVIADVRPGEPAAAAGLAAGDRIVAINGQDLGELNTKLENAELTVGRRGFILLQFVQSQVRAPVGTRIELTVETGTDLPRSVELVCVETDGRWSEPLGNLPSMPIECSAKRGDDGVGYLRFSLFSPEFMKEIRRLLAELNPGDGLVLDLRGNPGGIALMASGISGWLCQTEFSLGTMLLRQGQLSLRVFPQARSFAGPVAVLIDNGSASTSEILAAGLQETGRARVFGAMSAGAALPSAVKTLASGDLFQYAVADLKTPKGTTLEGRGVVPDELVSMQPEELAAGEDPVLAAAREWIARERAPDPDGRSPAPP